MPPKIPAEITLADLAALVGQVLNQQGHHDDQLHAIAAEVSRLGKLADQAEKFLHNPIGAYKAARLGKLPDRASP